MIYESSRSITSSLTPEWARRTLDDEEPAWELSWQPERRFTREQARDAMELTQLLSDSHSGGDAHRRAEEIAVRLGISVADAAAALYRRRLERGAGMTILGAGTALAEIFAGGEYRHDRMVRAFVDAGEFGIAVEYAIYLPRTRMRA